ncbi:MAG TPA: methyltransferase domain-containing protein, partial [Candidatus Acidoferrales bacterium]|nr:methyltransferase domain-containing protein [Candidatus Acidoferrales bacterium]
MEISKNWCGVFGAWNFNPRPAWAYPEPDENNPDHQYLAGEIFKKSVASPKHISLPTQVPAARTKNIIISGTNLWNPGDDFVREGVIRILKEVFAGESLNFLFYNFNPDFNGHETQFTRSNIISNGDLEKYRDFVDAVVVAGVSAGEEVKPLYRWVLANGLPDKVYLISGHYENAYCAAHISKEPEATIFRKARVVIGRTNKRPDFIGSNGITYHHVNCPALLSVPEVKAVTPGKKIERIGFSIQLPPSLGGIVNQLCAEATYKLAVAALTDLSRQYQVEFVAHHKTEYFHFLKLLRGTGIPVLFSSFYHDLHDIYRRYDLVVTTRLHTSLFANGHGIPGIIINDTDRHTHALEGFLHSPWVNTRAAFESALSRWQQADLSAISQELSEFKSRLMIKYVQILRPSMTGETQGSAATDVKTLAPIMTKANGQVVNGPPAAAPMEFVEKLRAALCQPENKHRVHKIISGLEKDYWLEQNLVSYQDSNSWFDMATLLNWLAHTLKPKNYLEIGVRRGRSMAQVLVESPETQAFGFDMWIPDYASVPEQGIRTTNPGPEFVLAELTKLGVTRLPQLTRGDSHITVPAFFKDFTNPQFFDVMLVDGDHTEAGARADLELAFAHLAPGGALIFDDICHQAHPELLGVWNDFARRHPDYLFLNDFSGNGTGIALRPPFDRLVKAVTGLAPKKNSSISSDTKRILFVRTDSIGDAVLASSMLEPLRRKYPQAKIAVLCQHHVADLFIACPFVDSIICYENKKMGIPAERAQILAEIAAFRPDLILNSVRSRDRLSNEMTQLFRGARHIAIEGDLSNISPADHNQSLTGYEQLIPTPTAHKPEFERHTDFLRGLDIESEILRPVVWTTPTDEQLADAFFQQKGLNPATTIAVFPGAQHDVRVYHGYGEALKEFKDFHFLIFGDASQEPLALALERAVPGRTTSLCGRSNLRQTAALLRRCRLYVGAESAGAHMACAVNVPNVVLLGGGHFGRFMPYSPLTSAVSLPLNCFGCNWRCPHRHAHCVKDLSPAVLAEAIRQTLEKTSPRPRLFLQSANSWPAGTILPAWKRPDELLTQIDVEIIEVEGSSQVQVPVIKTEKANCPVCSTAAPVAVVKRAQTYHRCPACDCVFTAHIDPEVMATENNGSSARHDHNQDALRVSRLLAALESYPEKLIDFGCGNGETTRFLQSKGFTAVGIDKDTEVQLKDIGNESIDGILMVEVIEHLYEPHTIFEQFKRILKPGGGIYVESSFADNKNLMEWPYLDPAIGHCTVHTLRSMAFLAAKHGFNLKWTNQHVCCFTKQMSPITKMETGAPMEIIGEGIPDPIVSVVVATHNAEILLRPCLHNLTNQTIFKQCEILVVDNGSKQNERAIVLEFQQQHPNIRYIRVPNPSLYGAWNCALKLARGRYWANANTDDSMRNDALEVLAAAMEKHRDCALGYCDVAWTDRPNDTFPSTHIMRTVKYSPYAPIDTLFYCITGCLQFWRTEALRQLGGFDAGIRCAGDYEPTLKLMFARMRAVHVPEVMSLFYQNRGGLTQGSNRSAQEHINLMERYRSVL